jgi:hypothetical protein
VHGDGESLKNERRDVKEKRTCRSYVDRDAFVRAGIFHATSTLAERDPH